jgi:hypothetical protein
MPWSHVTIYVTRFDVVVFISSLDHSHGRILSRRRGERPGDQAEESLLLRHESVRDEGRSRYDWDPSRGETAR